MNWFQKHYGKGFMPILAVIFIVIFSLVFSFTFQWWTGVILFVCFVAIFWFNRNTQ